jgi:hypothetical protein
MNRAKSSSLEPEVKQYGSHMVMTNVARHSKFKFINIDSKYRDNTENRYGANYDPFKTNSHANFNVTLPERINDVKSLMVCNAEIPMSFYNISATLGNNYFKIVSGASRTGTTYYVIQIPNGDYTVSTLKTAITTAIHAISGLTGTTDKITLDIGTNNFASFTANSGGAFTLVFDTDMNGNDDAYQFKDKLGWLLGFRKRNYTITSGSPSTATVSSENVIDLNTIRYLYLVVDEYTKGTQNSFLSPMQNSFMRSKTILAKITLNKKMFSFGDILPANNFNGYLLSDRRTYSGKVDLQKLNIQLIDDTGTPVDLNGMDFSFCLEVEHE